MDDGERRSGKRDRLARLTRLITVLRAHPDGVRVGELARRVDMSVRTVYRDLDAIDRELQVGVWSEGCLLYTSPSPRDRTRSRMPSSA